MTSAVLLTDAQRFTAERLGAGGAYPAALSSGCVFLYRRTEVGTDRWLVQPDGRCIGFDRF